MRMHLLIVGIAVSALAAAPVHSAERCVMSAGERAWADGALRASDDVMLTRLHLQPDLRPTIVLFNDRCRFEAKASSGPRWIGSAHQGKIRLPDGSDIDPAITSFASRNDATGERFFVMALPAVWQAGGKAALGDLGLTGVFLHEFSHTRQMNVLRPAFDAAAVIYKLPDDFSDDSIQKKFQGDPIYAAVIEKEADLLYRAAEEPDEGKARTLATKALALIDARQKRWFAGQDAGLKAYDDIFLTMEGFGQWNAYAWLSDPKGGGMTPAAAQAKMRGSRKWWSQDEGLALFLVIDRFVPDWASQAFGTPPKLGIDLLRQAVAAPAAG